VANVSVPDRRPQWNWKGDLYHFRVARRLRVTCNASFDRQHPCEISRYRCLPAVGTLPGGETIVGVDVEVSIATVDFGSRIFLMLLRRQRNSQEENKDGYSED